MPKQSEVLAARQKWIDFLKNPHRKKLTSLLGNEEGRRCCLGHGCYILLGPPTQNALWDPGDTLPPKEFWWNMVGMWYENGGNPNDSCYADTAYSDLADLNDCTNWSPQKIGKYLESVIRGGKNTPFRPLSDFKK